jgi:predicted RecA/RadA family phage recombinase
MDTYVGTGHRVQWTNSTGTDVDSGDVVALTDGIAIAVTDIAKLAAGALEMDGVHDLPADATTAFTFGEQLWWDPTAVKLYAAEAAGRVPAGMAAEIKATAGTSVECLINKNSFGRADIFGSDYVARIIHFDDFLASAYVLGTIAGWSQIDVSSSGTPTTIQAATNGGALELKAATTSEEEVVGVSKGDKLLFDVDSLLMFTCRFKVSTLAAVDDIVVGMISAYNVDPDSIAAGAWIRAIGAMSVLCECDGNGAGDLDDKDSTLDLVNDQWARILIDFTDSADVKFYLTIDDDATPVDLAQVQAATTFDISNYTAGLQPAAWTHKASGSAQNILTVDYIGIIGTR